MEAVDAVMENVEEELELEEDSNEEDDPREEEESGEEELEEELEESRENSPFGVWSKETAKAKGLKMLLYGASGAGKTRMAATFPKPLFLDLESGLRTTLAMGPVLRYPSDPNMEITDLAEVKRFYSLVKKAGENAPFETIVIDSLNELVILVTKNIVSKFKQANRQYDDQLTMADYGKLNRDFLTIVSMFLKLPYNIVLTAVETPREYAEQQVYPKFPGKQIGPEIQRMMEMIGYCSVVRGKDGKATHQCSFHMSPTYIAKDRMGIAKRDIPNTYQALIGNVSNQGAE